MAGPQSAAGDVIDVSPLAASLETTKTHVLLKSTHVDLVRIVMVAGSKLSEHRAPGDIIVHCLEGEIIFTALDKSQSLTAGQLLYLPSGQLHAVECVKNASFLLTILRLA